MSIYIYICVCVCELGSVNLLQVCQDEAVCISRSYHMRFHCCLLKYSYSCFSSYFCFLDLTVCPKLFMLILLLQSIVIILSLLSFFYIPRIPELLHLCKSLFWLVLFLLLFLTYSLSTLSLVCKAFCININFLALLFICLSSVRVPF